MATADGALVKLSFLELIGTQLAKFLTKEHIQNDAYYRISIDDIKSILKPGDVVLVEGQSRVSSAIQFITNSNWSHAAVFIGKTDYFNHCLIEVKAVDGCTYTDINTYMHHNLRVCRPIFLDKRKKKILINYLVKKIGTKYDLKNIIEFTIISFASQSTRSGGFSYTLVGKLLEPTVKEAISGLRGSIFPRSKP